MKQLRKMMIPLLLLCLVLTSCGGKDSSAADSSDSSSKTSTESTSETSTESTSADSSDKEAPDTDDTSEDSSGEQETSADSSQEEEPEPAADQENAGEIAERAMENFLSKVEEGNYTINDESFLKASVYSKDQVTFDYTDLSYNDFTVMSLDNEVFQALLTDEGIVQANYLGEGSAVDYAVSKLPVNFWIDENISQGNIYNLFYNSPDDPLTFVSYDDNVKMNLLSFAGYGEMAFGAMQEVYLVLDAEDPAAAHITAVLEDNPVTRISYDDIDVTVTFGDAESNPDVEKWMSNPTFPTARTGWTEEDIFILNSVFLPGYGEAAVPFPSFASYALTNDEENFLMNDEVTIRDSHATEEDMAAYIDELLQEGFTAVEETDEDGAVRTYYRRMLREEYKCYSSIELEYDNGVDLTARKYYDFPVYDDLDAVNELTGQFGFPALPDTLECNSFKATDTASEATESWLYFFDYDTVLYIDIEYDDEEKMTAYLNEYGETLEAAGFLLEYVDDTEEIDRYVSVDGNSSFRYHFEDGKVTLLYKSQKHIPAEEVEGLIQEAGFPQIDFPDNVSCRDLKKFEKVQYGRDVKAYITVNQDFETVQEAEEFLGNYEELLTEAGFGRVSPDTVGSTKQIAIYNEESGLLVGIDFVEENGSASVYYDFRAE